MGCERDLVHGELAGAGILVTIQPFEAIRLKASSVDGIEQEKTEVTESSLLPLFNPVKIRMSETSGGFIS